MVTAAAGRRGTTLLSLAGLAWTPGALLDGLRGEASLWQQEAQLYTRKAAAALSGSLPQQEAEPAAVATAAAAEVRLDPALAAALLAAPLTALNDSGNLVASLAYDSGGAGSSSGVAGRGVAMAATPQLPALDQEHYRRDYEVLYKQELPYFRAAKACGQCGDGGESDSPGALADRAWFDFLSYIQARLSCSAAGGLALR
jgi:hypothetical protein